MMDGPTTASLCHCGLRQDFSSQPYGHNNLDVMMAQIDNNLYMA